jgi:rRNA maturation RNase YbeY
MTPKGPNTPRRGAVVISSTQRAVRVPRKRLAALVRFVARREGARLAEVDIAVVGRRKMASLNRRWLRRRGATDVISFDLSGPARDELAAQIVVCAPVAAARARAHGCGVERELLRYVTHGLLHAMGYDDGTAPQAAEMHAREEALLDAFAPRR